MIKGNVILSLAAGLLGGVLSHYAFVAPVVHAQEQFVPQEIRAQSFILTQANGEPAGTFAFDSQGRPEIRLFDRGREIWRAGYPKVRRLASNH